MDTTKVILGSIKGACSQILVEMQRNEEKKHIALEIQTGKIMKFTYCI